MNVGARWIGSALLSGGLFLLSVNPAQAQPRAEGFALNRFEPSERGSDWFVLESLDLRGGPRFAGGLVIDYAHRPLMLYSATDGEEVGSVVEHQLFGHLGLAVVLWDRVRFGLNLPIAIAQGGDGGSTGAATFSSDNATTLGDLRLSGDIRFFGNYGDPVTVGGGLQLFAPTGSQTSFTSDGAMRFVTRAIIAGEVDWFVYAGTLGYNLRANTVAYAQGARGSEIALAAAAGGTFADDKLIVGPELVTSTVVNASGGFFGRTSTPLELVLGGHLRLGDSMRVNAGVGPGLTRAFGTPSVRALASVEWFEPFEEPKAPEPVQKPPPSDRDDDGIFDPDDACPDVFGVPHEDPEKHGCPPPGDRDGDTIIDPEDACPDVPGKRTDDPKTNGCPDRDGDGIVDTVDACPDEPGVASEDPKKHGCPLPKDTDGDGILDPEDACPKDPGPKNEDPKKNGCPVARVEKGQIVIREQVQFAYNSAQILKASDFILEAVLKILKENPEIKRVSVEGHTDDKGGDAFNKRLSEQRAKSVVAWLVKHGVDKSRFESQGFGEERPIDTNETDAGRANNRRVEFHIKEQAVGAPSP